MKSLFWVRGLLALLLVAHAFAADWSGPATELAKDIARITGPGPITLTFANASSLTKDHVGEIQRAVETSLRSTGVRVAGNATTSVRITLSENLQGLLWVAEVKRVGNTQAAIVSAPRVATAEVAKSGPSVVIHKSLLWSQPAQILDAILLDNGKRLVVLDANAVSLYSMVSGNWERRQNWPIVHDHPFPRDLRGTLAPASAGVEAYLPGTICTVSFGQSSAVICRDGDDAWKIGGRQEFYNSARNFFAPAGERTGTPFYSIAWLPRASSSIAVLAGIDGRVRLNDGLRENPVSASTTSDWGSDIAAAKSDCGAGTQLLVTAAGDDKENDSLRAYEIPEREPLLVSAKLDLPGPITAMWTHDSSVLAVVNNLQTDKYEAYSVATACNQ